MHRGFLCVTFTSSFLVLLLWFHHSLLGRTLPENLGSQVIFCEFTGEILQENCFLYQAFSFSFTSCWKLFSLQLVITMAHIYEVDIHSQDLWLKLWDAEIVTGRNVLRHSASDVFF